MADLGVSHYTVQTGYETLEGCEVGKICSDDEEMIPVLDGMVRRKYGKAANGRSLHGVPNRSLTPSAGSLDDVRKSQKVMRSISNRRISPSSSSPELIIAADTVPSKRSPPQKTFKLNPDRLY